MPHVLAVEFWPTHFEFFLKLSLLLALRVYWAAPAAFCPV